MSSTALDDRDFNDLVREALALLPVYSPEWTDHNPSDPGITLVELLAYFADALLYRIGRVTPAAKLQFLRLLKGLPDYDPGVPPDGGVQQPGRMVDPAAELERAIGEAVGELAHMDCAVTPADFERFATLAVRRSLPDCPVRVLCLANSDLSRGWMRSSDVEARGHVSVVLALPGRVPAHEAARVRSEVLADLASRCLLTTRPHVVAPVQVHAGIGFDIALMPGISMQTALDGIGEALRRRFENDAGTEQGAAFGQSLNLAAIAMAIDAAPGVDYVEHVTVLRLTKDPDAPDSGVGVQIGAVSTLGIDTRIGGAATLGAGRLVRDSEGMLASIELKPWEQLCLSVASADIGLIDRHARASARNRRADHG